MSTSAVTEQSTVVAGVDLGDTELASTVRNALEQVEKLLIDELSDGEDFLQEAALHLARAGASVSVRCSPSSPVSSAPIPPIRR